MDYTFSFTCRVFCAGASFLALWVAVILARITLVVFNCAFALAVIADPFVVASFRRAAECFALLPKPICVAITLTGVRNALAVSVTGYLAIALAIITLPRVITLAKAFVLAQFLWIARTVPVAPRARGRRSVAREIAKHARITSAACTGAHVGALRVLALACSGRAVIFAAFTFKKVIFAFALPLTVFSALGTAIFAA